MTTEYTQGPWYVSADHATDTPEYIRAYVNGEMFDVASVSCDETGDADANARLIAASPQLFEALQEIVKYFGVDVDNGLDELLTDARAAIHKATGQEI